MNRKFKPFKWAVPATLAGIGLTTALGQTAFQAPEGGWDYLYQGDQAAYGPADAGFDVAESLDGTWSHQNGSDEWDGSGIGGDFGPGNSPGGAMIIEEGGANYLRIQDPGDPRDYGFADPGSNRKVYLGHNLTSRGASDTIMDDGVTLYFRARIPTSGPLDPLHRDGQQANGTQPYPTDGGDGYVTSDGGKGNFVIKQSSGGAIAFSLTTATDTSGGDPNVNPTGFTGLTMNEFDGNVVSGNVNFGQGLGQNVIALDPTEWHEFWIVISRDEANVGTHIASIYIDGDANPKVFKMTAGTGSDFGGSYIALGATATPQNAALDIDFFGYKLAAVPPASKSFATPEGGWSYAYEGAQAAYGPADAAFDVAESLDGTWSHQNGSDEWDGSAIGGDFGPGNSPGGAMILEEGSANYLRIQDPGDPRDYGYTDPGSNRKVYLGHNITADGATDTIMDDGVTLHFRARIPTSGPLDPLHRDGQQANGVQPYPTDGGDGYVTSDGGKGNFVIKQSSGGAIAFSLTTATDTPGGDPNTNPTGFTGLTMNEFDGNVVSGNVNFGQGLGQNVIPLDPTDWHEFWITIARDEANVGTHIASIYIDGNTSPQVFKMTAGTGSDFGGSYIAIGSTATPQNSALDIDFYRVKFAAVAPEGASNVLPPDFGSLSPGIGQTNVDPTQGVRFVATSTGSIPRENIQVILNGRDFSPDLEITGNEQRWEVALTALGFNRTYEGKLVITDSEGASIESVLQFDTFKSDLTVIEGEDYNFESGGFLDNVVLAFNPGPDNYLDRLATQGVDANDLTDPIADNFYRIGDIVGTILSGDVARPKFAEFPDLDSALTNVLPGEWVNYTRTFANGEWSLIARVASGGNFQIDVGQMNGTATSANQSPTPIGSFSGSSTGGNARYRYFQLRDAEGKAVKFNANGPTTFRLTTISGDYRVNFLYIIPGADVPDEEVVLESSNVTITQSNGQITITWDKPGKLQSAPSVTGPWTDEASDANSWTGPSSDDAKYFRVIAQ